MREERDANDEEDEGQRKRQKKEESHWWTRFQVQISSIQLINAFHSLYKNTYNVEYSYKNV